MRIVSNSFEAVGNKIVGSCGTVAVTEDRFHAVLGVDVLNSDVSLQEIVETIVREMDGPIPIEAWERFLHGWESRSRV